MNEFDDILNNNPETPAADVEQQNGGKRLSDAEYAAMKKAERDGVYAMIKSTTAEIAGDSFKFHGYLDVQSRFNRYSVNNAILILAQRPDATRFGELKYWKTQKVFIKQSELENYFLILKQGNEYRRTDGGIGVSYDPVRVYDISQSERKILNPLPPSFTERQLLTALVSKPPVKVSGVDELPDDLCAMTNRETGEISVRKGMAFSNTFKSLAQELAAAELANGKATQREPDFSAYCASYLLCEKYGVDTQDFTFEEAPHVLRDMDEKAVKDELAQIRDAANSISERMERQLEAVQKAARDDGAR